MYDKIKLMLVLCIGLLVSIGCQNSLAPDPVDNGTGNDQGNGINGNGTLSLFIDPGASLLKAKPETVTNAVVTFEGFAVHYTASSGGQAGWVELTAPTNSIDVLTINSMEALAQYVTIPEGAYNILRFYATEAEVTTEDGESYTAQIISGKIQINTSFNIAERKSTTIVLTCNASVKATGSKDNPVYKVSLKFKVKNVQESEDDGRDDDF